MTGPYASQIATFLGRELFGPDVSIDRVSSSDFIVSHSLVFAKAYREELLQKLAECSEALAIVAPEYHGRLSCSYILSDEPKLDFVRVVSRFFVARPVPHIARTAIIGVNVSLGENVSIGEYSVIGDNVVIGEGTKIRHHVVIADKTVIGSNCFIKSHAVIGEEGYGFAFDRKNVPFRFPHLGLVSIGNNVEIGSFTDVWRGTIGETVIRDNVKIGAHSTVAHNVFIDENVIITGGVSLGGSSIIESGVWIGPWALVNNKIVVSENAIVGTGSVVIRNVDAGETVVGNPARLLDRKKRDLRHR